MLALVSYAATTAASMLGCSLGVNRVWAKCSPYLKGFPTAATKVQTGIWARSDGVVLAFIALYSVAPFGEWRI